MSLPLLVLVALDEVVPWKPGTSAPPVALGQRVVDVVSEETPEVDSLGVDVVDRDTANGL